jgi:hypothetical protein
MFSRLQTNESGNKAAQELDALRWIKLVVWVDLLRCDIFCSWLLWYGKTPAGIVFLCTVVPCSLVHYALCSTSYFYLPVLYSHYIYLLGIFSFCTMMKLVFFILLMNFIYVWKYLDVDWQWGRAHTERATTHWENDKKKLQQEAAVSEKLSNVFRMSHDYHY